MSKLVNEVNPVVLREPEVAQAMWLDFESGLDDLPGGGRWLVSLAESGEVLPLPTITPVPLMQPWFVGVANVRGVLFGIVDFSVWRGGAPTPRTAQSRLLLIGAHCALLVQRTWGLQTGSALQMLVNTDANRAPWYGARMKNASSQDEWARLDCAALLTSPAFLKISI